MKRAPTDCANKER